MRPVLLLLAMVLLGCETRPADAPAGALQGSAALTARVEPLVAKVTVLSATGREGTTGTRREPAIFTDLELRVDAPIRGAPGERLAVTTLGGRVGERAMHVSGHVQLHAGDEAIVWVDPSSSRPFIEVLPVRDGHVYALDGRPLVAVREGGLVFGGREQPARPAPVPQGTAKGTLLTPEPGPALAVGDAIEALKR